MFHVKHTCVYTDIYILLHKQNDKTIMKRVSKKEQYIHSLNHDLEYFNECINSIRVISWFMGEMHSKSKFKIMKREIQDELKKIEADKNYKPWKELAKLDK